jgi:DNA-binding CsgD family transcriptional regulator/PAS domain-containing protein
MGEPRECTDFEGCRDFDALLGLIYEGPLEPVPWQGFLEAFRELMSAMSVGLILRPPTEGDRGLLLEEGEIAASWRTAFQDRYFALDPFIGLPVGEPATLEEIVPLEELIESDFYTEYMKPMGSLYALAVDVREPGGLEARLRAVRRIGTQDFGKEEKTLCARLVPHLQRALQIHGRLRSVESERDLYADTVDHFAVGTILLDDSGRLLRMNHVAERVVRERDGLTLQGGRLRTGDRDSTQKLERLIEDALAAQNARRPSVVEALRVERPSGNGHIGLLIRPVPVSQWTDGKAGPSVAVFIGQPGDAPVVSPEILQNLFAFTRAEASVASLLAEGLSVEDTARTLGISIHTARSHVRSLFSKTGVSRQTELVLLILRSAASLG